MEITSLSSSLKYFIFPRFFDHIMSVMSPEFINLHEPFIFNKCNEPFEWSRKLTFCRTGVCIFKFLRLKLGNWTRNLMTMAFFPRWTYSLLVPEAHQTQCVPQSLFFFLNNRQRPNHLSALICNEMPRCTACSAVILGKQELFTTISSSTAMRPC